ncbi:MAG: hypothetical protein J0M23_06345 [Rickettsiales bacterium]|nr:hypothetical protein [Rickettsiales bacterium]
MKDRFRRMWIEHKSKDKKPEEVVENDTAKALEKMISILSKSDTPELIKTNQKLNLVKKRYGKKSATSSKRKKKYKLSKNK